MEHRWDVRHVTSASAVTVHHLRHGATVASVRNASLGGAFIELNGYPRNLPVTLMLPLGHPADHARFEVPAMIVRFDAGGAGVMFLNRDNGTKRMLRRWLEEAVARSVCGKDTATVVPLLSVRMPAVRRASRARVTA